MLSKYYQNEYLKKKTYNKVFDYENLDWGNLPGKYLILVYLYKRNILKIDKFKQVFLKYQSKERSILNLGDNCFSTNY